MSKIDDRINDLFEQMRQEAKRKEEEQKKKMTREELYYCYLVEKGMDAEKAREIAHNVALMNGWLDH